MSMIAKKKQPLLFFLKTFLGPPAGCMRPLFLLLPQKRSILQQQTCSLVPTPHETATFVLEGDELPVGTLYVPVRQKGLQVINLPVD